MDIQEIKAAVARFTNMTPACREVAESYAKRYSAKEAAAHLGKAYGTVRSQLDTCRAAIGVRSAAQLAIVTDYWELLQEFLAESPTNSPESKPIADVLSPRQVAVAHCVARGHSNAEIKKTLGMSLDAVKCQIYEICNKLGASNRIELARWIIREEFFAQQAVSPAPL